MALVPTIRLLFGILGERQLIVRQGDILLAHAEKSADADDHRGDLAFAVDEHIVDVADALIGGSSRRFRIEQFLCRHSPENGAALSFSTASIGGSILRALTLRPAPWPEVAIRTASEAGCDNQASCWISSAAWVGTAAAVIVGTAKTTVAQRHGSGHRPAMRGVRGCINLNANRCTSATYVR